MYLITNTSFRDSLWVEGTKIASQKSASFKTLKPLTLAILKRTANAKIQLVSTNKEETKEPTTDFTTVSDINKQKPAKKTVASTATAEASLAEDDVVDDKEN